MKPAYFIENAYSIYPKLAISSVAKTYKVETPENSFEWKVFRLFHQGKKHLYHEEYALAFDSFKELSHLILKTVHPQLPADPNRNSYSHLPQMIELLNPMLKRTAEILRDTPVERHVFPDTIVNKNNVLAPAVANKINKFTGAGLSITSHHSKVNNFVELVVSFAEKDDWCSR